LQFESHAKKQKAIPGLGALQINETITPAGYEMLMRLTQVEEKKIWAAKSLLASLITMA